MKKKWMNPVLITALGALLMLFMVLLPFASAKKEYKEHLREYNEYYYLEEIEMINEDAIHISLVEYLRVYIYTAGEGIQKEVSVLCIVMIGLFLLFEIFTLIATLSRKAIAVIIWDLLTLGAFWLIQFDFRDRGVVPNSRFDIGIVHYLTYVLGVVVIVSAVWMFAEKRKAKKLVKNAQIEVS